MKRTTQQLKVKLTYFKPSGKLYSTGMHLTHKKEVFEIFEEVRTMINAGKRPGLVDCKPDENSYGVLIETPDHPNGYPAFIYPKKSTEIIRIDALDDYSGTLSYLRDVIQGLIKEYGAGSTISVDAGYNNVMFCVRPE